MISRRFQDGNWSLRRSNWCQLWQEIFRLRMAGTYSLNITSGGILLPQRNFFRNVRFQLLCPRLNSALKSAILRPRLRLILDLGHLTLLSRLTRLICRCLMTGRHGTLPLSFMLLRGMNGSHRIPPALSPSMTTVYPVSCRLRMDFISCCVWLRNHGGISCDILSN